MTEEDIKSLNLLPLTRDMVNYICEYDPRWLNSELNIYSYVKFFNGKVYLYTPEYIEKTSKDQFSIEFVRQL